MNIVNPDTYKNTRWGIGFHALEIKSTMIKYTFYMRCPQDAPLIIEENIFIQWKYWKVIQTPNIFQEITGTG